MLNNDNIFTLNYIQAQYFTYSESKKGLLIAVKSIQLAKLGIILILNMFQFNNFINLFSGLS